MSTRYIEILAIQTPYDIGIDPNGRVMFSNNYNFTTSGNSDRFEEEVVKILSDASLATLNSTAFIGSGANIPDGDGPFILVRSTGGTSPELTHDGKRSDHLSCQIVVYAGDPGAGMALAMDIYHELDGTYNLTVAA